KNPRAQATQQSYANTSPAIEKPCKDCRMNCVQQNLRSRRRKAKQCCRGECVDDGAARIPRCYRGKDTTQHNSGPRLRFGAARDHRDMKTECRGGLFASPTWRM